MKMCDSCGAGFKPRKKTNRFCSRVCWRKYKRSGVREVQCETCGKKFQRGKPSLYKNSKRVFCSHACSGIAKRKPENATTRMRWYLTNGWGPFRTRITVERGNVCESCGAAPGEKSERLTLHHLKDPYKPRRSACALLDESNVILLCHDCHESEHHGERRRNCIHCGEEFECWPSKSTKYCSHPCYIAHTRKWPRTKRCEWCETEFIPSHPKVRSCSRACGNKLRARKLGYNIN